MAANSFFHAFSGIPA